MADAVDEDVDPSVTAETATSPQRAVWELAGIGLTSLIWFFAQRMGQHVPVLAILVALWVSYFLVRAWRHPTLLRTWGILPREWRHDLRIHAKATLVALLVIAVLGLAQGTFTIPRHAWFILIVYPGWAWCQQFLLQNVVVGNAARLGVQRGRLPLVGGLAFGAAHLPDLPLAGLTMLGGLLWTWLWLRAPNLWVLALGHTVLGIGAFVWVLGRNPLSEYPQVLQWLG